MHFLLLWFFNITGINNGFTHAGTLWYNFWSGIGLTLFLPGIYYWHHLCHDDHCYKFGHKYPNGIYCKTHKPVVVS